MTCWLDSGLAWGAKDDPKPSAKAPRLVVARAASPRGTIARRERPGLSWKLVGAKQPILSEDLLLGLHGAALQSKNGAVELKFWTDLLRISPHPVIETAVQLHVGTDLDFTLDRGLVTLTNKKKQGAAWVRLRVRDQAWTLKLAKPGTTVVLELFGRWEPGAKFTKTPGPKDVPTAELLFLVAKGEAEVDHGDFVYALTAPKGPAQITWDSVHGMDKSPEQLDELPKWATPEAAGGIPKAVKEKAIKRQLRLRDLAAKKSIGAALDVMLASEDPDERRLAIYGMAATDDLDRLLKAYLTTKKIDVLDDTVVALRHWIGRGPGQDLKFYNLMVKERKVPPVLAATIMQLLHGFSKAELDEPETYEMLVDYLKHDRPAIRALAHWHLVRLLPKGAEIKFDPLGSKEDLEKAYQQWLKLLPQKKKGEK
jgi:hypothetical protein